METGVYVDVPDFGSVVVRERLLGLITAQSPALILICAPGGYGKSVLASQVFAAGRFDELLWVSALDEATSGDHLLVRLARALSSQQAMIGTKQSGGRALSKADALLAIDEGLKSYVGRRLCLVVDGCSSIQNVAALQDLATLLRRLTARSSALVVTCRRLDSAPGNAASCVLLTLDEGDLRFSEDEVRSLQALVGAKDGGADVTSRLMHRYCGHPALTSLVLRHRSLDEESSPPQSLRWYTDRLVQSLSQGALATLYVAALLQDDTLANISGCIPCTERLGIWEEIRTLSPLLVFDCENPSSEARLRVHAVLGDSARRLVPSMIGESSARALRAAAMGSLRSRGCYARLLRILQGDAGEDEIADWLTSLGPQLLRYVGHESVRSCLQTLSPELLSGNPSMLLLRALILREEERYDESHATALLGADIAEAQGLDQLRDSCLLLVAWLGVDASRLDVAKHALSRLESRQKRALDVDSERLVGLCATIVRIQCGETRDAADRISAALASIESARRLASDDAVRSVNAIAGLAGTFCGDWPAAARLMTNLVNRADLTPSRRVLTRANLAVCLMEMGSLREAKELLDSVIDETESARLQHLAAHAYGTRSSVNYGLGNPEQGLTDFKQCNHLMGVLAHEDVRLAELLYAAVNRRSLGLHEEALSLVEQAELILAHGTTVYLTPGDMVSLEAAAAFLSLGDVWGARRRANEALEHLSGSGAHGHLLRADLILAEADRSEGAIDAAIERLACHADYVATGSANWLTAMYVRAFPGLLGLLAKAFGADKLPLRMLLMVPPKTLDEATEMAPYLSPDEVGVLWRRRGSESVADEDEVPVPVSAAPPSPCHARLFGGLEVTTELGVVDEDSWRKRKARLLFIILLLRQHQDVPRDVLLERLWPDMDEEHAKRNFYVTWSTMKRALACGRPPSAARSLVQCSGGVCRVTRQVRSDLDDFEDALASLRAAAAVEDVDTVLAAGRRLIEIYRGELLPGDLYEEWLAEVRERSKHDFCDAMMMAASAAASRSDTEAALLFLRKASAADPWREDVYQSMMRCQMSAGQRSRAIETYLSCRSRLTEDLGIDPSVETTRIYQAVLAMEEQSAEAGSPTAVRQGSG